MTHLHIISSFKKTLVCTRCICFGVGAMCFFLVGCQLDKSIIDEPNVSSNQSPDTRKGGDLDNGIWFKDTSARVIPFTFAAKPNEEKYLMAMQGHVFSRSTEQPLTKTQINGLTFELRGANADLFTLEQQTLAEDNPHGLPAGEQTVLIFNKNTTFFFDEVKKRCRICTATLVARASNGTEAVIRVGLKLLPVDAFSFSSIRTVTSLDEQEKFTLNLKALAKEGVSNQLYLISSNLVQGKGRPNINLFTDLKYDKDNNGVVDITERLAAADAAFWASAIPTSLMFRQSQYTFIADGDKPEHVNRFSIDFSEAEPWFKAIESFELASITLTDLHGKFTSKIDTFKKNQGQGKLPVVRFNAPVLTPEQRIDRSCAINGVGVNYYRSEHPYRVSMLVIPTDETALWLKINLQVYVVGSQDENHQLIWRYADEGEQFYTSCWDYQDSALQGLPAVELLPKQSTPQETTAP